MEAAVKALSEQGQKDFWEFTQAPIYGDEKTSLGVFWTNTIHIYSPDSDDEYGCLCWKVWREYAVCLLYSCCPLTSAPVCCSGSNAPKHPKAVLFSRAGVCVTDGHGWCR